MTPHTILGIIAVVAFAATLFGRPEGIPIGLIFLTLALMFV